MTLGECLSRVRSRLLPLVALVALAAVLAGCKTTALMAPAGDYLYWGDGDTPSIVHKVRTSDLVEVGSLALPSPAAASAGALSPDGSIGYVVNSYGANGTITKFRLADMTALAQVPFGVTDGNATVITPDGSYLYIAADDGTISEVRSSDLVVTRTLTVSGSAFALHAATIAPDGRYAYFGDTNGGVVKVHLADLAVVGTVAMPAAATFITTAVISPDGQYGYYTADLSPTSIVKVRLADMTVVSTAPLSVETPASTVISPDGQYAYVMNDDNPALLLTIRLDDPVETRSEMVALNGNSGWSTIAPDGQFAYLGNGDGVVKQVRLASPQALTVAKAGTGSGIVSSTAPGIDCGATCTHTYLDYQSATLTATPAAGSAFAGWSGACAGTGTCAVAMGEARSVTATFSSTTLATKPPKIAITNAGVTLTTTFDVGGAGFARQAVVGLRRASQVLCRTHARPAVAGRVVLRCTLGRGVRNAMTRGAVRLRLDTSFAPTSGTRQSTARMIVLPKTPLAAVTPPAPVTG